MLARPAAALLAGVLGIAAAAVAAAAVPAQEGCFSVPGSLFHAVEAPPVLKKASGWSFSGNGSVVGLLLPPDGGKARLVLLKGEKLVSELFLSPPPGYAFKSPELVLGPDGDTLAVVDEGFFAAYAGTTCQWVEEKDPTNHRLFPFMDRDRFFWTVHPFDLIGENSPNGVVVWAKDLASGARQAAWEIEKPDPQLPFPARYDLTKEAVAFAVPRQGGGLWVLEAYRGRILEKMPGKPVREVLAAGQRGWKRREDTPEGKEELAKKEKELKENLGALVALPPNMTDATKTEGKGPMVRHFSVRMVTRYFLRAADRRGELLVQLGTAEPKAAVLWVKGEREASCFSFQELTRSAARAWEDNLAFTEHAVWLAEPFGYVPLADLEALANPSAAAPAEASRNEPRR